MQKGEEELNTPSFFSNAEIDFRNEVETDTEPHACVTPSAQVESDAIRSDPMTNPLVIFHTSGAPGDGRGLQRHYSGDDMTSGIELALDSLACERTVRRCICAVVSHLSLTQRGITNNL